MSTKDDPRDAALATKFTLPPTWYRESEGLGSSGMFLSGLIMVTRNRYLAWPSVLFGLNQYFNQHPMRAKEGTGGLSNLLLCISALFASYMPLFVINTPPNAPAS
ncbi:uncharacterized protein BT62DRAFT_1003716 [Guyanagaster necrorhizus]|uniref:Uncharacterized protein n=1 Tax=Guyanagaster necrorhizus TaxID=856835 RepID=A0A9P7VWV9_9AGAR|nr:uncharacterized protein BT62DRAFT_1003716 [Guyanagaster necrorhizus MCA 3950]KAG7447930.1 hypothetical protein BT62DRAFT_1003716 [Guyanagaster necrorhizus MCA 3950]